ncbi:GAF domain-containing protein [Halogeometricum limi]|uniref:GAF domain-containing protein n=1 Tax=Halogeometricum limi TaxID=555875 RepID=A0A1I6GZI6_9EURY|nr:GAF domain-containing protein [Halogeometricum limi]SFR47623.1 GAF domain-containing protein [Halogeometricum limi]
MSRRTSSGRVLVVLPDATRDSHETLLESLRSSLDAEIITRRGQTAAEYVYELGPTIDCAVALDGDEEILDVLVDVSDGLPVLVYGETTAEGVSEVISPSEGESKLLRILSTVVESDREQNELQEVNAKLTALSRHASAITGCQTVSDVCEETLRAAVDALAFTFCVVALVEGDRIVPQATTLRPEDQQSCHVSEGVGGRTYRTGETQIVDDVHADEDALFREQRRSAVSVPIGSHGIIQVVSDSKCAFTERDADFLEILAGYTTEALSRLDREAALRGERDRLHAFFDNLPVPAVYVEEQHSGDIDCEVNHAYDATFGSTPDRHCSSLEAAFPTDAERDLFAEHLRADEPVVVTLDRETATGERRRVELTLVPIPGTGPTGAAYGVYSCDEARLSARSELS